MKRLLTLVPALALIASTIVLAPNLPGPSATGRIGIPNPAAKHCGDIGGTYKIDRKTQTGYCTKDGKTCEEWALYRGTCQL